jgi:hypothetical protein
MANALYDKGREAFLAGDIDWLVDVIRVQAVDAASYTVSLTTHQFLSDVPGGARIGSPVSLGTKTATNGVADAADVSITGLVSAPTIEALVIYKDTGTAATSALIAYIDTATGLPTPAGATQLDIVWDAGTNRIFKL